MITGLEDRGFDWGTVDLVVGTSCGAVVGAQLAAGRPASEIRDRYSVLARASVLPEFTAAEGTALGRVMNGEDEQEVIRGIGQEALAATTARSTEWLRAEVLKQVGDENWPARRLVTTAVDIDRGTFHELTAESGLSMIDAVVASSSLPFLFTPATLGGRRYADGFLRSPANADCARGYERVLILSSMDARLRTVAMTSTMSVRGCGGCGSIMAPQLLLLRSASALRQRYPIAVSGIASIRWKALGTLCGASGLDDDHPHAQRRQFPAQRVTDRLEGELRARVGARTWAGRPGRPPS